LWGTADCLKEQYFHPEIRITFLRLNELLNADLWVQLRMLVKKVKVSGNMPGSE
jgi:hypothetical protein